MSSRALARRLVAASAAALLVTVLSGCGVLNVLTGNVTRDDSGEVTEGNDNADVFAIRVGDCLNDASVGVDGYEEVDTLPIVSCDEPHDSEVVLSVQVEDGDFPGVDALTERADSECLTALEEFIGISYDDSVYGYGYYHPTVDSWANGDREILCTVGGDPDGKIVGTLQNVQR